MNKKLYSTSAVVGKFYPPHMGHAHLIQTAANLSDSVIVLVDCVPNEKTPAKTRQSWLEEYFKDSSNITFKSLSRPTYQSPEEYPGSRKEFFDYWVKIMNAHAPSQVIIGTMDYIPHLARACNREHLVFDTNRQSIGISATSIKSSPVKNFNYLLPNIKHLFSKKIALIGPESTGKTTVAKFLSKHYNCPWVPEMAKDIIDNANGELKKEDILKIAHLQRACVDSVHAQNPALCICDSDLNTTHWWAKTIHPDFADLKKLKSMSESENYDLTLLFSPNTPWYPDTHRATTVKQRQESDEFRLKCFNDLKNHLKKQNRNYLVIDCNLEDRANECVKQIDLYLDNQILKI